MIDDALRSRIESILATGNESEDVQAVLRAVLAINARAKPGRKPTPPTTVRKILARLRRGDTLQATADACGVGRGTVASLAKTHGVVLPKRSRKKA